MTKGKIIGMASFEYDVKDKNNNNMKTGERRKLGKVFVQYSDDYVEGLACAECIVNADKYATMKLGQEVFCAKFKNKLEIAD